MIRSISLAGALEGTWVGFPSQLVIRSFGVTKGMVAKFPRNQQGFVQTVLINYSNIDGYCAVWQAISAKEWSVDQILKDSATFIEPQFPNEMPTTPLLPFRQSAEPQLRFRNSNGSRNWEIFGPCYPNISWNSPTNPSANIERQVTKKFSRSYL